MALPIPLGQAESATLEFKGADASLGNVAREVVALLNAGVGGEIWWGVREEQGRAIAEDPFPDGAARRRDLQNHLIDTIEPSPLVEREVSLESVPASGGGELLCIRIKRPGPGRAPFAQFKDQGRRYWIRAGDRVRIMSRQDLAEAFGLGRPNADDGEKDLLKEKSKVEAEKTPCFWMMVQPVGLNDLDLDIQDPALRELLTKPEKTRNRSSAWTFVFEMAKPKPGPTGLRNGDEQEGAIEIRRTGAVWFKVPQARLEDFHRPHEIYPDALLEFPVSVMRLASVLLERWGGGVDDVLVDFALVGFGAWSLRAGSPRSPAYSYNRISRPRTLEGVDVLVRPKPFHFKKEEVVGEPDRCGLRLISFVYEAFGHLEDAIPPEFDRRRGTLFLPLG